MATSSKCALVVDDSKSARVVLRKMLEKHSLHVEAAASAEQAIDFLSRHSPDIIFMDHMMPGMDGFQAVQHIKDNPNTAMIPIVMYTSQNGEVYVGQARALGAVDVLAKDIQPTELQKVLKRLNLIEPEPEEKVTDLSGETSKKTKKANQVRIKLSESTVQRLARETSDLIRVPNRDNIDSDKVNSLLEEQRLSLRQDIMAATRNTQVNIGKQFESFDVRVQYLTDLVERDSQIQEGSNRVHLYWFMALLMAASLVWYLSHTISQNSSDDAAVASSQSDQVISSLRDENQKLERDLESINKASTKTENTSEWLSALQWAVNLSASYDYSDTPLDDQQLIKLRSLVDQLEKNGFRGTVNLNVHVGNFCLQRNTFDELELGNNDLPLESCSRLELPLEESISIAENQSINFANFVSEMQSGVLEGVTLRIILHGNRSPLINYPERTSVTLAKKWNEIARQNNRIEYQIVAN